MSRSPGATALRTSLSDRRLAPCARQETPRCEGAIFPQVASSVNFPSHQFAQQFVTIASGKSLRNLSLNGQTLASSHLHCELQSRSTDDQERRWDVRSVKNLRFWNLLISVLLCQIGLSEVCIRLSENNFEGCSECNSVDTPNKENRNLYEFHL